MSDKDAVSKDYLSNNRVFADIVNFTLFKGKQVVDPASLRTLDTALLSVLPEKNTENDVALRRFRDLLKEATYMTDGKRAFLMIGIESQSTVDNTMPVRNMLYDAMVYARQAKEITEKNHGRFRKNDLLVPVITLVIYFGDKKWDAPKSLYELFPPIDKEIEPFVSDYRICVVEPAELTDDDFEKFKTDIGITLKVIRYLHDVKILKEILQDERMQHLDRGASKIIRKFINAEIEINEEEEKNDMRNGFDILIETEVEERVAVRLEKRVAEQLEQMVAEKFEERLEQKVEERVAESRTRERLYAIKLIQLNLNMTAEEAMNVLEIPEEERNDYMNAC